MANISEFNLAASEPLDFSQYKAVGGGGNTFPPKDTYTLTTTDVFPEGPDGAFKPNKANTALTAQIDPTIAEGPYEGRQLRFFSGRISAKTYQRGKTTVSKFGDFLKAVGRDNGQLSGDPQEQADAIEACAGLPFQATLDWRLWAAGEGEDGGDLEIDGMERFPQDDNGNFVPFVESKTQINPDNGLPKRLWANLQIVKFIPLSA